MTPDVDLDDLRATVAALADAFLKVREEPDTLPGADAELLTEALGMATRSVLAGDYDSFKLAVAAFFAQPGLIPGGRAKWRLGDIAGDMLWRMNREALKRQIRTDLDRFLEDLLA